MFFSKNNTYKALDDQQLLLQYRETGEKALVGELFKRYSKTALGACMFYLEDKDEAKDAVMQIFDKLYLELKKNEIKYFKGWLSFVLRNHCISLLRKKKTESKFLKEYLEFEKQESSWEEEEKILSVDDSELTLDFLKEALIKLKEKHRICIQLFYLENKSYNEISASSGFSINEVKSYIQNGKRNLKLMIEESYRTKNKTTRT